MACRNIQPFTSDWPSRGSGRLGRAWLPDRRPNAGLHNDRAGNALVQPQQAGPSWIGTARNARETLTALVVVARFFVFIAGILVEHGLRSLWRGAVRRDARGLRYRLDCGGAAAIRGDVPSRDHAGPNG
jgi:hypothetical protein